MLSQLRKLFLSTIHCSPCTALFKSVNSGRWRVDRMRLSQSTIHDPVNSGHGRVDRTRISLSTIHCPLCTLTLLLALAHVSLAAGQTTDSAPADNIFFDGNILTGERLLTADPERVSAVAVRDGLVIAIGSDAAVVKWRGRKTEVVDLHGAFAMPGFNDAHVHLASAGREKLTIDLVGVKSLAEMQQRIRAAVHATDSGPCATSLATSHSSLVVPTSGTSHSSLATNHCWLRGRGWDHTLWASKQLPARRDLDAVTADHPAVFTRVDGHIAVANTRALDLAGITATTPDPGGGKIDRDDQGAPTGIVRETAVDLIYDKVPPPSHQERRRALELALADAAAHGVTSVQDYSTWDDFLVMEEMEREGKLPIRISEWLTFLDPLSTLIAERSHHAADDPMLHTGMLKGFMDGSLGSRTAALKAPYSDDPGNAGIPQFDQATLNQMTIERAKAGFQIGFHAIGDRAVSMALNAFSAAEAAVPNSAQLRFRIEHDQVVDPADFARYEALAVIASMQPSHLLTDMNWAEQRIGPERAKSSYAWKTFWEQGTPLPFGTDYPVEPISPFRGLYAAITRQREPSATGHSPLATVPKPLATAPESSLATSHLSLPATAYYPEQALTVHEALFAYTQASAYAEFAEKSKGKLVPGYDADFILLDRDLLKSTPQELLHTRVLRTVVGGKTVYRAGRN